METIAEALERFNEYMRDELLEWHIGLLKRRMEKMGMEKESQDLKVSKARSTCEECEEYNHVLGDCPEEAMVLDYMRKGNSPSVRHEKGKTQFNASSSIQNPVPLCIQLKDFVDEQAKINKDIITKFKAMGKILENIDGKVMEVRSSIHQVLNMMKILETQVEQLVGRPMVSKGRLSGQPQGPEMAKDIQTHSGEMEDHTKETTKITTEGPEFEMPSQYMKMPPHYF
jgi:hypothetical protein